MTPLASAPKLPPNNFWKPGIDAYLGWYMTGSLGGPLHCFSHLLNSLSSAGTAAVTKTSMMTLSCSRWCTFLFSLLQSTSSWQWQLQPKKVASDCKHGTIFCYKALSRQLHLKGEPLTLKDRDTIEIMCFLYEERNPCNTLLPNLLHSKKNL